MGIRDRDYMKGPSDGSGGKGDSVDAKLERFASDLLGKNRKWVLSVVIAIAVLLLIGILMALKF